MNLTVGQAIARLQANGHTFLAVELENAVSASLSQLAGQKQAETHPDAGNEATDSLDSWLSSRGFAFPPNSR